ncbi:Com family DNA-binding transcriptional regulator [Thalassovita sp.]|uniref:Com family DNA-binding transcriptional regulator n=1 Tax=Thalassovita sp. TaxID=1979401 RepID=UPI0039B6FA50
MKDEQRCGKCARLLFKMEENALIGTLSIKCPRCKTINTLRPPSPQTERPERDGNEVSCGSLYHHKT